MIERLTAVRYVVPLREGGSLPAVVETDRAGPYVVKFRGAGQGAKALIAEVMAAELALELGLQVPTPAIVALDERFGKAEPNPEIQDILRGSVGANFGLEYLPGALAFDPATDRELSAELAADIVWFDALITNVDRTPRNTNLLLWEGQLWLIDHGASLYFHHQWRGWEERIQSPFPQIKEHVLLPFAGSLVKAHARLRPILSGEVIRRVVAEVPGEWLGGEDLLATPDDHRDAYVTYLNRRLDGPLRWLQEAIDARGRGPTPLAPRFLHRVV